MDEQFPKGQETTSQPSLMQQIEQFYSNIPSEKGKDNDRKTQEIRLMAEALQSPETARAVLERKLEQLAAVWGYDNVTQLESVSEVSQTLKGDSADRARAGFPDGSQVFLHIVNVKGLMVEENDTKKRGFYTYDRPSRLFWARDDNGKLIAVRTNFPQIDHVTVEITDDKMVTGTVSWPWLVSTNEPTMELTDKSPQDIAPIVTGLFNEHINTVPLKIKIRNFAQQAVRQILPSRS